jgi:hypothetical protein
MPPQLRGEADYAEIDDTDPRIPAYCAQSPWAKNPWKHEAVCWKGK